MSIDAIWDAYRAGAEELVPMADSAEELFYVAVLAHRAGDSASALTLARRAARQDPDNAVYAETARYLERPRDGGGLEDVYESPQVFTAFARGGSNVGLYRMTHQALRECYTQQPRIRLLDIGTGEGHGLLPALTTQVAEVDIVEPSRQRIALVTAELHRRGLTHRAYAETVQDFAGRADAGPWDLVQETFALLTLSRSQRRDLFGWLRPRAKRIAFVEFDVPDLGSGMEPRCFRYVVDAYARGIREYTTDRDLVAQSFLVPVLLSVLGNDGLRHHEQPIDQWVADLADAGFQPQAPRHLFDYWWAPAYLISAS